MLTEAEQYAYLLRNCNGVVLRARSRPATREEEQRQARKYAELLKQYDHDLSRVIPELNRWCDEQGIP